MTSSLSVGKLSASMNHSYTAGRILVETILWSGMPCQAALFGVDLMLRWKSATDVTCARERDMAECVEMGEVGRPKVCGGLGG